VFVKAELPTAAANLTVLTAASGEEVASWDDKAEHGLFTEYLLAALYGEGDANRDGAVTAAEVKAYLDRTMTKAARRSFLRLQHASLIGATDRVLATARDGAYPPRPTDLAALPPAAAAIPAGSEAERALGLGRPDRKLVQRALNGLDLDAGPADGLFGPKTRGAIKTWQEKKGLAATGYLIRDQADALIDVGRGAEVAAAEAAPSAAARRTDLAAVELAFWESVKGSRAASDYRAYLEAYPKGRFAPLARSRAATYEKAAASPAEPAVGVYPRTFTPGEKFQDCATCPEMVVVPAGSFRMGDQSGGGDDDEKPVHRVRLAAPFAVGVYEVTFDEWDACASAGGCTHRPGDGGWGRGRRPVINVNWDDAREYVRWLSRETGKRYRLLSESEWEYVARSGSSSRYHWGDSIGSNNANCGGCGSRWDNDRTAPVGSFAANGFGLHDVHGNVWEWVEDCYHGSYSGAPSDGRAWTTGGDCEHRVLRGGSWGNKPRGLRAAYRDGDSSGDRINFFGFRVARTLF